jgi:hypothetical protein
MAKYTHPSGGVITTKGSVYTLQTTPFGEATDNETSIDISKWSDNAETWIDNDIKDGYYQGFEKVTN